MIQKAFRNDAMNAADIKVWYTHSKDGRESVESDPCSGRPATSRIPELNGYGLQLTQIGN